MWSSIGLAGAFALVGVSGARVLIMWIALRGSKPAERPEIIRALNDAKARASPRSRAVGRSRA